MGLAEVVVLTPWLDDVTCIYHANRVDRLNILRLAVK